MRYEYTITKEGGEAEMDEGDELEETIIKNLLLKYNLISLVQWLVYLHTPINMDMFK